MGDRIISTLEIKVGECGEGVRKSGVEGGKG